MYDISTDDKQENITNMLLSQFKTKKQRSAQRIGNDSEVNDTILDDLQHFFKMEDSKADLEKMATVVNTS